MANDPFTDEEHAQVRHILRRKEDKGEIGIGFGSWKVYMKGIELITFMFITYIFGTLYIFWEFKKETSEAHRLMVEGQNEQTFLFSLTPEQRANLGIQMPESLARRLVNQQKYDFTADQRRRLLHDAK